MLLAFLFLLLKLYFKNGKTCTLKIMIRLCGTVRNVKGGHFDFV